jgi:hypothetical protein
MPHFGRWDASRRLWKGLGFGVDPDASHGYVQDGFQATDAHIGGSEDRVPSTGPPAAAPASSPSDSSITEVFRRPFGSALNSVRRRGGQYSGAVDTQGAPSSSKSAQHGCCGRLSALRGGLSSVRHGGGHDNEVIIDIGRVQPDRASRRIKAHRAPAASNWTQR